jgi:hypothetical protein
MSVGHVVNGINLALPSAEHPPAEQITVTFKDERCVVRLAE